MALDLSDRLKLAKRLFDIGRLEAAEGELRLAISQDSHNLSGHVLLGVIAAKTNRPDEAVAHLETALALEPNQYDALTWLATVRRSQNDIPGAVQLLQRAILAGNNQASVFNLLGICQLSLGQAKEAASSFSSAISMAPRAGQSYHNLGMALRLQNHGEEAVEAFRRAVELAPEHAPNYLQIFKQLQQLSRWTEAVQYLKDGLKRHSDSVLLAEALATAYGRLGLAQEAEKIFRPIARTDPSAAQSYAKWLQEQGRFEDSVRVLKQSINLQPLQGTAYRGLAEAKAFETEEGTLIDQVLGIIDHPTIDGKARMHLSYALGKAYDHAGEFQKAMRYFDMGNELAYRNYPAAQTFDPAKELADPAIMAEVYPRELIERMRKFGSSSIRPIFIVGMIRSGTTLLDQIISSHPAVSSAGEQPFWNVEADRVHRKWRQEPDVGDIAPLAEQYLSVLELEAGGAPRVTDKMPLNFRHLGLISIVFPEAKILHIRRDPLDTCLSIYMTFFHGGPNFTYKQENIVAYYRSYLKLMEHWRRVLPSGRLYELDYETLVTDHETTTRRLIEFCGLPWNDACSRHQENRGSVTTPSRWQARQPIYATSMERWRRYEPWLGALLDLKLD